MTKDQAKQLLNDEKFKAFAEGRKVEWLNASKQWVPFTPPRADDFVEYHDRIRLTPEKKRVPLEAKDVPLNSWFQIQPVKHTVKQAMVTLETWGVSMVCKTMFMEKSFKELMNEDWLISRDNGKTWQPCWKEEES